ncbi:MAG: DUF3368 domain-containing protein [Anaerolineae bacterium]|nr:DUF3368 domain-containing protein [Anaerolineae bacterium]
MTKHPLVCDTTLLLYLGRIGQAQLLPALFEPVCVPEPVASELDMGRLMRRDTINPRGLDWASLVPVSQRDMDSLPPNRLGVGERAVIAYVRSHPGYSAGLDDRQARLLAEIMGLTVVGTIGVLLRAKEADLIPTVRSLLDAVQSEGFRLGIDLYQATLRLAGEGGGGEK